MRAEKPSRRGWEDAAVLVDPSTAGLRKTTIAPVTIRVSMAQRLARGMSRSGLWASSAASGSSSIPRKSHIAKGIA